MTQCLQNTHMAKVLLSVYSSIIKMRLFSWIACGGYKITRDTGASDSSGVLKTMTARSVMSLHEL